MSKFTESFQHYTNGLQFVSVGVCPNCTQCADNHDSDNAELQERWERGDICDEPSFSWHQCDTCGSRLGGDRMDSHAILDGEIVHMSSCIDCCMYIANGDEPETWS